MPEVLRLFWGTVVLRPYVFAFLAIYIIAGAKHIGWKKTLLYIPVGYALAWTSEYCSINWGFPYGDYYYIPTTAGREIWVLGVPFMDSLSYVFLSYCSFSLALFITAPLAFSSGELIIEETQRLRRSPQVLLLGAFLFVMLDVIIDPVALLGEKWFLGKIYGYRHEGFYFGIPMSNFGGWLLVGALMIAALQAMDRALPGPMLAEKHPAALAGLRILGPVLYFSVMFFNTAVTFSIGENLLGLVDLGIVSSLLVLVLLFTFYKLRHYSPEFAGR
jgi:uncharacterized membrane protein